MARWLQSHGEVLAMFIRVRSGVSLVAALCTFSLSAAFAAPPEHTPTHARIDVDSIFINGKVITMDDSSRKRRIVQAFAIKDGRFIAAGSNGEAMRHKGRDTRVVDLLGRTVLPGL